MIQIRSFKWFYFAIVAVIVVQCRFALGQQSTASDRANAQKASSLYEMGSQILNSAEEQKSAIKAITLLEDAVAMDSIPASILLAEVYDRGRWVERDSAKALELLSAALSENHPDAMALAGFLWDRGWGPSKSVREHLTNEMNSMMEDFEANQDRISEITQLLFPNRDYSKAVDYYERALEARFDSRSAYRLGTIELFGIEATANSPQIAAHPERGVELLTEAANAKHNGARFLTAFALERGIGQVSDLERAIPIYRSLVNENHIRASIALRRLEGREDLLSVIGESRALSSDEVPLSDGHVYNRNLAEDSTVYTPTIDQSLEIIDTLGNRIFNNRLNAGQSVRLKADYTEQLRISSHGAVGGTIGQLRSAKGTTLLIDADEQKNSHLDGLAIVSASDQEAHHHVLETEWTIDAQTGLGDCVVWNNASFTKVAYSEQCDTWGGFNFFSEPIDAEDRSPDSQYPSELFSLPAEPIIVRLRSGLSFTVKKNGSSFEETVPNDMVLIIRIDPERTNGPANWKANFDVDIELTSELAHLWEPGGFPALHDGDRVVGWLARQYNPESNDGISTGFLFETFVGIQELTRNWSALERLYSAWLYNSLIDQGPYNNTAIRAHYKLAEMLQELGEHEKALHFVERGLEHARSVDGYLSSQYVWGLTLLFDSYLARGERDLAAAVLDRAIAQESLISSQLLEAQGTDISSSDRVDPINLISGIDASLLVSRASLHLSDGQYQQAATILLEITAREVQSNPHGNSNSFVSEFVQLIDALRLSNEVTHASDVARYIYSAAREEAGMNNYAEPLPRPYPVPEGIKFGEADVNFTTMLASAAEDLGRVYYQLDSFRDAATALIFAAESNLARVGVGSEDAVRAANLAALSESINSNLVIEAMRLLSDALGWKIGMPPGTRRLPNTLERATAHHALDLWISVVQALQTKGELSTKEAIDEIFEVILAADQADTMRTLRFLQLADDSSLGIDGPFEQSYRRWRQVLAEIKSIDRRLASSARSDFPTLESISKERELRARRETLRIEHSEIQENLESLLVGSKQPKSFAQVSDTLQAVVRENEAIVIAMPLHSSLAFIVINKEGVHFRQKSIFRVFLEGVVDRYRRAIEWPENSEARSEVASSGVQIADLVAFREIVWDPIADLVADRHLTVVPYGSLRAVPFEAIPLGTANGGALLEARLPNIRFLGLEQQIAYSPSIALLSSRFQRTPKSHFSEQLKFVGFGDPIIGKATAQQTLANIFDWLFRGVADGLENLDTLQEANDEIRKLQEIFTASEDDIFLRERATLANLRQSGSVRDADVLAFSTHAFAAGRVGTAVFAEPFLLLSSSNSEGGAENADVKLQMSEIMQMDLRAKLVLLSACETAASDGSFAGDGFSGLVQAFFLAGAHNVVASHWKVESRSTYYFVTELASIAAVEKVTLGEAMLKARRKLFYQRSLTHPKFWSAFVLMGELNLKL